MPLQGATASTRDTQGAASLALGYEEHWAFSPPLLNLKLEVLIRAVLIENASSNGGVSSITQLKHPMQALMGATRLASEIFQQPQDASASKAKRQTPNSNLNLTQ